MKELLVLLEEDWKKFKGRKEIELMETWASFGRRLTLSYAGQYFFSPRFDNLYFDKAGACFRRQKFTGFCEAFLEGI